MISLFTNWKERCSSLGYILTKEEKITAKELLEIEILKSERDTGINKNGNKVKWTERKKERYVYLTKKRDAPDELPSGVKTHLDNVFRTYFDGRNRILNNQYTIKGEYCEQESAQLLSDIDGEFYDTETGQYKENDFICGTPDLVYDDVKDLKTNYDKDSFDNAGLTKLYEWQIRGYCWLYGKTQGELVYCLVNNPIHQLNNKLYYLKNALQDLDGTSEEYKKEAQQLERNMIFDIEAWKQNYPNYDFENPVLDFSISKIRRIKRFDVELLPKHIAFIKKRVKMCREYLIKKEQAELEIIKNYSEDDYKAKIEYIKSKVKQVA